MIPDTQTPQLALQLRCEIRHSHRQNNNITWIFVQMSIACLNIWGRLRVVSFYMCNMLSREKTETNGEREREELLALYQTTHCSVDTLQLQEPWPCLTSFSHIFTFKMHCLFMMKCNRNAERWWWPCDSSCDSKCKDVANERRTMWIELKPV